MSAVLVLPSAAVIAVELTTGKPELGLASSVESITLETGNFSYQKSLASSLTGVRVVHYLNGALAGDEVNKHFLDRINDLNLDASAFGTLSVLNATDVSYLLQQMAKLQVKDLQRTNDNQELTLGSNTRVPANWDLPKKGPSITLLDESGNVIAHKNGKLKPEDEKKFVALIQRNLPREALI